MLRRQPPRPPARSPRRTHAWLVDAVHHALAIDPDRTGYGSRTNARCLARSPRPVPHATRGCVQRIAAYPQTRHIRFRMLCVPSLLQLGCTAWLQSKRLAGRLSTSPEVTSPWPRNPSGPSSRGTRQPHHVLAIEANVHCHGLRTHTRRSAAPGTSLSSVASSRRFRSCQRLTRPSYTPAGSLSIAKPPTNTCNRPVHSLRSVQEKLSPYTKIGIPRSG